jgi:putative chitinase
MGDVMTFMRDVFFDSVRHSLFGGVLNQGQVDGMNYILDVWEAEHEDWDFRWLAYALATTIHETASTMQPIEEYGHGGSAEYAQPDPQTGQCYYGRGFVQLTWADNYLKADKEIGLEDEHSCYWHAENALDPAIAAEVMFRGMNEAWFRSGQNFSRYFNDAVDDPWGAREIINGDKTKVPSWSSGVNIGNLIKGYHLKFLDAIQESWTEEDIIVPPDTVIETVLKLRITVSARGKVRVVGIDSAVEDDA